MDIVFLAALLPAFGYLLGRCHTKPEAPSNIVITTAAVSESDGSNPLYQYCPISRRQVRTR